jgi:hypothetical protein
MESLWSEIATLGPLAMAGLGIAVSLIYNLPRRKERWYFVIAFLACGVLTWKAQDIDRKQLIASLAYEARGGDSYCYFHLNIDDRTPAVGPWQLFMHGVGSVSDMNYWISPAWTTTDGKQPEYGSLDYRKLGTRPCPNGVRATDRTLPGPGEYRIEFDAANGHWDEIIKISVVDGKVKQEMKVTTDKGKLLNDTAISEAK